MWKTVKKMMRSLGRGLRSVIPVIQDPPREWVRKLAFLMALLLFVGAGYYLLDELWWQPQKTMETAGTLRDWYHAAEDGDTVWEEDETDTTVYPEGMDPAFKRLYRYNNDVRGWLTFTAGEGTADLFNGAIDNPVVQTTDNDYYLTHDFWGDYDKAGTLFFDYRNDLNAGSADRNRIIYGHNLTSELMFSRFNLLASGDLNRGRALTTMTLDTLYEKNTYKVIAVMVVNVDESEGPVFNYLRTDFSTEKSFLNFVEEIRRRSLYDFGDVDVQAGDQLLTLSTCSNRRDTHLKDGRVVVVARRVREGEDTAVDVSKTTVNEDVLMPVAWYVNQGKELPEEYRYTTSTSATKPTFTIPSNGFTPTFPTGSSPSNDPVTPADPTDPVVPADPTAPSHTGDPTVSTDNTDPTVPSDPTSSGDTSSSGESTDPTDTTEPSDSTGSTDPTVSTDTEDTTVTEPSDTQTTVTESEDTTTVPSAEETTAPQDTATTTTAEPVQ